MKKSFCKAITHKLPATPADARNTIKEKGQSKAEYDCWGLKQTWTVGLFGSEHALTFEKGDGAEGNSGAESSLPPQLSESWVVFLVSVGCAGIVHLPRGPGCYAEPWGRAMT